MRERTKVAFCGPTGANGVEAALNLAKTATGRSNIVAFQGSYHGGSHGARAVSSGVESKELVAGQMPGVHFFPYPYALRCSLGGDPATLGARCSQYLDGALRDPLGGVPHPAAVILEVVQGEGGVIAASTEFLQGVRQTTRELGIPLIVDEVQSGCGRTGTWLAFEQHNITPDVIVMSKAVGGLGMPIAIVLYDESLDVWEPRAHTGTVRGTELAFAAGVEALRIITRDNVLDNVRALGADALTALQSIANKHERVAEARGVGLMLGIEFADPATGAPDGQAAMTAQRAALERGLITELGGRDDAVLRLLPPLNLTRRTLDQAVEILTEAVALACAAG
jgi:diaminobutyrate-2-oxoglutarate transaminase